MKISLNFDGYRGFISAAVVSGAEVAGFNHILNNISALSKIRGEGESEDEAIPLYKFWWNINTEDDSNANIQTEIEKADFYILLLEPNFFTSEHITNYELVCKFI